MCFVVAVKQVGVAADRWWVGGAGGPTFFLPRVHLQRVLTFRRRLEIPLYDQRESGRPERQNVPV